VNRLVVFLAGGVVVLGAIAVLVYSTTRTEPAEPTAGIDSRSPKVAPPAAVPSAANRPKPAASAPAAAGTPATTMPKADAAPTTGTLVLESDTPDTTVFIDRKFLGTAPQTLRDVSPGEHQLIFSPTGQDSIRMTVQVEPGTKTIVARFKELQLDEKVEVVHKHAFGSCRGTLKASPNGLTYDTKNAEDAFTVPLTNPDIFAVNYVEKNLKVKLKGSKTYTFVEPDGTADKLYAFHQAVDKARQRLLSGRRP
jgi:PEGA domain